MIRGTTPTFSFGIKCKREIIDDIEITLKQSNANGLEKPLTKLYSKGEVTLEKVDSEKVSAQITLTQAESFSFKVGSAQAQVRVLTTEGKVAAQEIGRFKVGASLSEEEIV